MDLNIEQTIHRLELELLDPQVRRNRARLSELIADDFFEIGESGRKYTKQEAIETLCASSPVEFKLVDFAAVEIAPGTIETTYRVGKMSRPGGDPSFSTRTSIWRNRNGRWEIAFHRVTREKAR